MRTSEHMSALFADQFEHGDVVSTAGRILRPDRVWPRVALLRAAIENGTTADHPSDIFDAAYELAQIVGAVLVDAGPVPAVAA